MLHDRLNMGAMFSFRNPARWRRPFPDVYRDELDLIVEAERLGFDTIWLTEHHFADDGYSPSIVTIAAAVAARTERVRIGFNLLLLPLHNAIELAEDIATLDVLSNGRIDVGLGQGYALHEFAGFGIPLEERLSRFIEGLDILSGMWQQDPFSYEGRHYRVSEARLSPRPVQQPTPPIWIGATSSAGIRRAGRRGAHLLGISSPKLQREYEQARTEAGHDPDAAKALQLHWTHVADDDDTAWAEATPHFHHLLTVYAGWLQGSGNKAADAGIPPEDQLRGRRVMFDPVFGSPATVAGRLQASMDSIRTTHLALGMLPGMDPAVSRRSLERFAREVAPALR
ncbi:MAG: LLM class flavin-dependent oxidoreductase [Acidimicrobiales bacterium]|nr:LLM class flavin-dependent oxidoreductase [Acidimicrobiales bacterium]